MKEQIGFATGYEECLCLMQSELASEIGYRKYGT